MRRIGVLNRVGRNGRPTDIRRKRPLKTSQAHPMPNQSFASGLPRREFLKTVAVGAGVGVVAGGALLGSGTRLIGATPDPETRPPYRGPNVILIRFGGGARRRETIDPEHTYAPFLCHELSRRGVLFKNMEIDSFTPSLGVDTSHGQGTLYLLTGK